MNLEEFDSRLDGAKLPERKTYETIQPGTYAVEIIEEETKQVQSGSECLTLTLKVEGGKYGGQRIWCNLYLKDNQYHLALLGQVKQACGIQRLVSSSELVGHKLKAKTKLRTTRNGTQRCEVSEFKSITETGAGPQVVNPEPGREFGNDDYPF
jgi:hypothetical protein